MKPLLRYLPLLALGLAVVVLFSHFAPYCMDEFLQYNEIIYGHYPNNRLNSFNEAPDQYDLDLYGSGFVLPIRAYYYMGVVPSLYYYPLFRLWSDPMSARFLGVLFLLAQAMVLSRWFAVRLEFVFIGLLAFFPFMFLHLVETGMVGPQILGLVLLLLGIQFWPRRLGMKWPLGLACVAFMGIWVKLSFLWYAPALCVWLAYTIFENRRRIAEAQAWRRLMVQGLAGFAALILLSSLLFMARDANDPTVWPYWDQLFNSTYSGSYSLSELLDSQVWRGMEIYPTLWNPLRATERIFTPAAVGPMATLFSLALYGSVPMIWIGLVAFGRGHESPSFRRSVVLYGCFWLTLLVIFRTRESWSMHHTVMAYPFMIASFLAALKAVRKISPTRVPRHAMRLAGLAGIVLFVALNGYFFAVFPRQKIDAENDPSRIALNARLKDHALATQYFYVVLDWGVYFYQALYGDRDQSVLYIDPMMPEDVARLKELKAQTGRALMFIYHPELLGHNLYTLGRQFQLVPCDLTGSGDPNGTGWRVLVERPAKPDVCL